MYILVLLNTYKHDIRDFIIMIFLSLIKNCVEMKIFVVLLALISYVLTAQKPNILFIGINSIFKI